MNKLANVHPGEMLFEEFPVAIGIGQKRLVPALGIPPPPLNDIGRGKRAISANTTPPPARYFGTSEAF